MSKFYFIFFFFLNLSAVSAENILRVVTSPDYPPYEFYQQGEIVGLEVDIIRAIAERLGKTLSIKETEFASIIGEVKSKRSDLAFAAIGPSEERAKSVDFTVPYDRSEGVILYHKSHPLKSLEDLHHMVLAAQLGSTHEHLAEKLVAARPGNILRSYNKAPEMLQDLKNNRVQGMVVAFDEAVSMLKEYPHELEIIFSGGGEDHVMVMPKGHPLLQEVNRAITELKDEGKILSLKKKWQVVDPTEYRDGFFGQRERSYWQELKDFFPSIPFIVAGVLTTFEYAILSVMLGLFFGTILGIAKILPYPLIKKLANLYTSFFRGTPLLVQLGLVYFGGRPLFGHNISAFFAGILTFSLNSTAYISEILRAGLESVDKGQWEASLVLGLSKYRTLKTIILPQAFRRSLPSLVNEVVDLIKESALISTLGEADLLRRAYIVASEKYLYFEPLLVAALVYYVVILLLGKLASRLESQLARP